MIQLLTFAVIYGIMMFIWSVVYLNKSNDKVNQSFLAFLSMIILWMVLSVCNNDGIFGLVLKSAYWISMMSLAVVFLFFTYRLIRKRLDTMFYTLVAINTLTIIVRYCYPIDYTEPEFWRMTTPIVAPLMSAIFSLPAIYALFLLVFKYRSSTDKRQKVQLSHTFWGIGIASAISVLSEYILPAIFDYNLGLSLMYVAILIFVLFMYVSIMKYKLLNLRSEYLYRKLVMNSPNAIVLVAKNRKIISVNDSAKKVLRSDQISTGDPITDYLPDYDFDIDYQQNPAAINREEGIFYLSLTQYPIDADDLSSAKILTITDITQLKKEKDWLVKKSITDPLTGFYTKQYVLEQGIYQEGCQNSILFIDIDDFKLINDLCGHSVADQILAMFAEHIKKIIRHNPDAKVVRFGGDEFVVILENETVTEACNTAERIREEVIGMDLTRYSPDIALSLSIGVANGIASKTCSINTLIQMADIAMYRSKSAGKNKVTVYTEENAPR